MFLLKRYLAWTVALVAVLGVCVSYIGIWVISTNFTAGLVWWADAALVSSGPLGGLAALFARIKPRQRMPMILGFITLGAWVLLLVLMFTVLGFKFNVEPETQTIEF